MKINGIKDISILIKIWVCVLWFFLPLIWDSIFQIPYLPGARGLQSPEIGAPFLISTTVWAIILSIPKSRNAISVYAAGGFLIAVGFFLMYFSIFANTGYQIPFLLGAYLLKEKPT